jgi:hypothetical protein
MDVTGAGDNGVLTLSAKGLTFRGVRLRNNGNSSGDSGLYLGGLTGTNVIDGTEVSGSYTDNVQINNSSGTLAGLTFSNCTVKNTNAGAGRNGIYVLPLGSAVMNMTVSNCVFQGNRSTAIQVAAFTTAQLDLTLQDNTVVAGTAGNPQGDYGVQLSSQNSSQITNHIDNNEIGTSGGVDQPLRYTGIQALAYLTSTLSGTITGNTLVTNTNALLFVGYDTSTLRENSDGNTIKLLGNAYAIQIQVLGGTADAAFTNNTLNRPAIPSSGILFYSQNSATTCGRITGNMNVGGGVSAAMDVEQMNTAVFRIEGLALGAQSAATTKASLMTQNPASAPIATSFTGVPASTCTIPL